jgi:hypothetical protein
MDQPQSESTWTQWEDESDGSNRNMVAAGILASAVAAGVIAFMLRRARQEEEERTPVGFAGKAFERTRDAVGDERMEAGRDFLMKKVVPEFKPALLSILEELEDVVEDAFKRAEKAIKSM